MKIGYQPLDVFHAASTPDSGALPHHDIDDAVNALTWDTFSKQEIKYLYSLDKYLIHLIQRESIEIHPLGYRELERFDIMTLPTVLMDLYFWFLLNED